LIRSVLARVYGRVQGVGFRYSALNKAKALRLKGWIKNEADGSVTARFEGPIADVEEYISWLKLGPSMSFVKEVFVSDQNVDSTLDPFHVLGG
jgi:acylphosphatase